MKVKTKKVMAMLCLILILLTTLPIQALATFITDINSDAVFGVISGSLSEYNHELHYATYDGSTYMLFCVQRGVTSPNGSTYTYNSSFIAQYKADRPAYEKIAEMIYFRLHYELWNRITKFNCSKTSSLCNSAICVGIYSQLYR